MKNENIYDLFNPPPESIPTSQVYNFIYISGLTYISNFITKEEEKQLLKTINEQIWLNDLKRRVQHYGWKYNYRARFLDLTMYLGDLPTWAQNIAQRLVDKKLMSQLPDQIIINEYEPGQGIANHVDCEPCFGDTIISLSLSTSCIMNLINLKSKERLEMVLEPRSVILLKEDARYLWSHGIPPRFYDIINGKRTNRDLRISMTFRKVIL